MANLSPMNASRNARFWVYLNGGIVKLTLKPGQRLSWCAGGPCDEGYSWQSETWTHEGDQVRNDWATGGRDCDGRHQNSGVCFAPLDELTDGPEPYECDHDCGVRYPAWLPESTEQYDEYAELAGY